LRESNPELAELVQSYFKGKVINQISLDELKEMTGK
jgi:hypothetical protein